MSETSCLFSINLVARVKGIILGDEYP